MSWSKSRGGRVRLLSWLFGRDGPGRLPATKGIAALGIGVMIAGVVANEFVVARYVSAHGTMDATTISSIRWVQGVLFVSGMSVLMRSRAALLVLFVALAMLNLAVFQERVTTAIESDNVVTEGALRQVGKALAVERHVGYISDEANARYIGTKGYYLTQYAVAPIVVEAGATRGLIIGNFLKFDRDSVPGNLRVVRDFGGGLLLLRKRSD